MPLRLGDLTALPEPLRALLWNRAAPRVDSRKRVIRERRKTSLY
jgi:hypothetical protein